MVPMELYGICPLRGSRFLPVWAINLCFLLMNYFLGWSPGQQKIVAKAKSPISWKDSGLVPPYPQFGNSRPQADLWKIPLN